MKKPRLPELPVDFALVLAILLVASLGRWGKIDIDRLKEWQTLAAALVALGAAGIAYAAAMSKLRFDREVHNHERAARRLGLFLRLRTQISDVGREAASIRRELEGSRSSAKQRGERFIKWEDFAEAFDGEYGTIDEAWQNLELFPIEAFEHLNEIRNTMKRIVPFLEENHETEQIGRAAAKRYATWLKIVSTRSSTLNGLLTDKIEELQPYQ